jgi:hypothetical protein
MTLHLRLTVAPADGGDLLQLAGWQFTAVRPASPSIGRSALVLAYLLAPHRAISRPAVLLVQHIQLVDDIGSRVLDTPGPPSVDRRENPLSSCCPSVEFIYKENGPEVCTSPRG